MEKQYKDIALETPTSVENALDALKGVLDVCNAIVEDFDDNMDKYRKPNGDNIQMVGRVGLALELLAIVSANVEKEESK